MKDRQAQPRRIHIHAEGLWTLRRLADARPADGSMASAMEPHDLGIGGGDAANLSICPVSTSLGRPSRVAKRADSRTAVLDALLRLIGFAPAATFFGLPGTMPKRGGRWPVVVPYPAKSSSTGRLIDERSAPNFLEGSSSSITSDRKTPSLVRVGAPNLYSKTLRPSGEVTRAQRSASWLMPAIRGIRRRGLIVKTRSNWPCKFPPFRWLSPGVSTSSER